MTCVQMELEVAHHFVIDVSAEIQNLRLKVTMVEMQACRCPGHGVLFVYVWCVPSCYENAGHNGGKEE